MLTVRKKSHGGQFVGTESERERLMEDLLKLEPKFFDLEYDMRPHFIEKVLYKYPKTQFVLSAHYFQDFPSFPSHYEAMSKYPAFAYKIACFPNSANLALQSLLFAKTHPKVSLICMGENNSFARILGPIFGNTLNYASLDSSPLAPGQLSYTELLDIYQYNSLNSQTACFGLIGDPVTQSIGHIYHNGVFRKENANAVYVKIPVRAHELPEFLILAKEIGIRGLSVTMPLKEKIVSLIEKKDPIAEEMGAVNTLLLKNGKWFGTNTDGMGALDAIEKKMPVKDKKMVLLGAGGTAAAIAMEAKKRGAQLVILNRTLEKGKNLAKKVDGHWGALHEIPPCDILVNCSPTYTQASIPPKIVAMDVVYNPKVTPFIQEAQKKDCQIIYGEEMFLNQAARQSAYWLTLC